MQRRPRQHDDIVDAPPGNLRLHEHPHRERGAAGVGARRIGVVDLGHDVHHPAHRVDLAFSADDPSLPGVPAPGEIRREDDVGADPLLRAPVRHRHVDIGQFFVGERQPDLGRVDRVDPADRRPPVHELPDVDVLALDPAGVRSPHLGALQIPSRAVDRRLGRGHRGPGVLDLRLPQGQGVGVSAAELLPLPPGHLRFRLFLGEPEPGLRELRLPRDERLLVVVGIDLQQDLSLLEEASDRERRRHVDHGAGDLRHELAGRPRLHRALARDGEVDALERDPLHPYRRRGHDRGLCLHRRAVEVHDVGAHGRDAQDDGREERLQNPIEHW